MSDGLSGHVALVTGGVRGIGLAISKRLADAGAVVAAGYSRPSDASERFLDGHRDSGATIHQGNIGSNDDCERVVTEVLDRHGRLDILVNNAGITMDRTIRRMTPQEWDKVLQVNLHGTFYKAVPEEALANVIARVPCGRLGEVDEVARVVEFLVDPASSYITGDVYSINGGLSM